MREKIEYAKRRAEQARENALSASDQRTKEEWFTISRVWGELAHEYETFKELRTEPREGTR